MLHRALRLPLPSCTCRRLLSTSTPSPPFLYTTLPTRSLLSISGKDSSKLLQGLISNDIYHLGKVGTRTERLLFSGVLKADGRMLYDIFIHPSATTTPTPETEPSYLIDHDSTLTTPLQTYLKRHILRSKVKLAKAAESDKVVITAWLRDGAGDGGLIERGREWLRAVARAGEDYRAPGLGWRWVALKEDAADLPAELFTPVTPSHHHLHRLTLAIPEGPTDWPQLPLEGNLELMGGVDYRKGCYVGQELTARTFFKGVVRKRGVGVRLFREGEDIPTTLLPPNPPYTPFPTLFPLPTSQSSLTPLTSTSTRPRPSGKIGSSLPLVSRSGSSTALAFASVRLEHIDESGGGGVLVVNPLLVEGEEGENGFESGEEGGRWLGKAFVPDWVRERLEEASRAKGE